MNSSYEILDYPEFKSLVGKTLTKIDIDKNEDEIYLYEDNGNVYLMKHFQDCCEHVKIEDICGDIKDLLGTPIIMAELSTNSDGEENDWGTFTWTFYKLATEKGYVTIRWYGESNGYYSEEVDFLLIKFQ